MRLDEVRQVFQVNMIDYDHEQHWDERDPPGVEAVPGELDRYPLPVDIAALPETPTKSCRWLFDYYINTMFFHL